MRGVVVSTSLAPRALPYIAALASRGGLLLLPEELVSRMYSLLEILCQGYDAGFKECVFLLDLRLASFCVGVAIGESVVNGCPEICVNSVAFDGLPVSQG